jgi:hypothetical protein
MFFFKQKIVSGQFSKPPTNRATETTVFVDCTIVDISALSEN